jgi:hypothetical protein
MLRVWNAASGLDDQTFHDLFTGKHVKDLATTRLLREAARGAAAARTINQMIEASRALNRALKNIGSDRVPELKIFNSRPRDRRSCHFVDGGGDCRHPEGRATDRDGEAVQRRPQKECSMTGPTSPGASSLPCPPTPRSPTPVFPTPVFPTPVLPTPVFPVAAG